MNVCSGVYISILEAYRNEGAARADRRPTQSSARTNQLMCGHAVLRPRLAAVPPHPAAYRHQVARRPRACVIEGGVLVTPSGRRRFWPVRRCVLAHVLPLLNAATVLLLRMLGRERVEISEGARIAIADLI